MAFHDVRFPTAIAFGASGGPMRRTEIVRLASGFEERNAVWSASLRRFDAGPGMKSLNDCHAVIAFFEARRGRLHGFRFKDWSDWKSCPPATAIAPADQALGTGDGVKTVFDLIKTYEPSGPDPFVRRIVKPVSGTVRVALATVEQMSGITVDHAAGTVTFATPPGIGVAVTAGFQFDVPARFDSDDLTINLATFGASDIPNVPIVELRL